MGKTKYNTDFPLLAQGHARQGLSDQQIAYNLGIHVATYYRYQNEHQEFREAILKGKRPVDIEVENALLKRALGYEYEEVHVEYEPPQKPSDKPKPKAVKKIKKFIPPDVGAITVWLFNRRGKFWKDKRQLEIPPGTRLPLEIILSNGDQSRRLTAGDDKDNRALPAPGDSPPKS